jgi:hypothetical protein
MPSNGKYLDRDRAVTLALGTLGGPTIGDIAEGYGSLAIGVKDTLEGKKSLGEAWTPAGRFALRHVPIVGPAAQNYILPYGNADEKPGLPAFKGSTTGFKGSNVGWRR